MFISMITKLFVIFPDVLFQCFCTISNTPTFFSSISKLIEHQVHPYILIITFKKSLRYLIPVAFLKIHVSLHVVHAFLVIILTFLFIYVVI